ncbi:hypothetical protein [Geothrix sp. PMB-07]|uniref:hypothetical protein n=1 Tax=Geothrix sp. PMB-07 TaxID=3068640 RepID=UPI002740E656|nr:hypothetical protein [Geothrix sp. PMB-07]WLT32311.1 hypothetical protein Q9293_03050 [Geothrix sp. PMB-07]
MTDSFQTRIPSLSDAELQQYLHRHLDYRTEAVEAALAELDRRGLELPPQERATILDGLQRRDDAAQAQLDRGFVRHLGTSAGRRLIRIRQITAGILAVGLGTATIVYLRAAPKGANPLGYEPEDTKKYLRDLELYGGKVNVLATEFMKTWDGLWQGRNLAYTLAVLTLITAFLFWFLAHRQAVHLAQTEGGEHLP